MSTKSLKNLQSEFTSLFSFEDKKDKWDVDARVLVSKFLAIIESKMKNEGLNKKKLASKIDISGSYVTQIFRGNKLPNFITMAKMLDVLDVNVDVLDKSNQNQRLSSDQICSYLNRFYEDNNGDYIKVIKNPSFSTNKGKEVLSYKSSLKSPNYDLSA